MRNFSLLAVPAWEPGRGGGHLIRQTELVRELRKKGACAWLYLPQAALSAAREGGLSGGPPFPGIAELLIDEAGLERGPFSLIVLDRFKTPPEEWKRWSALGPTAALDEGGRREEADFLIDLLPAPPGRQGPNLSAPWLLPLPRRRRPSFAPPPDGTGKIRILISFGAEDRAGLSVPAALALARSGLPSLDLTVVFGPLRRAPLLSAERAALERAGVRVIEALRGEGGAAGSAANSAAINADALPLRETLADYDLVITHFGLTAFEALHARVPALLVSPTARHERLARHAGLLSAGTGGKAPGRLPALLSSSRSAELSARAAERWGLSGPSQGLADFFLAWEPALFSGCPLCPSPKPPRGKVLARFPRRTCRRCSCGTVYMDRWDAPPQRYGEDYFFSAYKKQYGKTYLEDFPVLQKNGEKRLRRIKALLPLTAAPSAEASAPAAGTAEAPTPPRLLEIGCAYGPFLAAAAAAGFDPLGIDPAGEAVDYVRAKLGLPAIRGFFPDDWKALPGDGEAVSGVEGRAGPAGGPGLSFDAVSLWFVIEHFRDPRSALEEIYRILKPGGVLAFSTPSFNGVSRRKSAVDFLSNSPEDHYTIWDPRYCAGVLAKFGFRTRKIVITGIHPERLPLVGFLFPPSRRDSGFYRFFSRLCSLLGWGDTFEVYAVKEGFPRG